MTSTSSQVMSTNSDGATGGLMTTAQAPRLAAGGVGFSTWQANMDVFLQRHGAEGVHRTVRTAAQVAEWRTFRAAWADEELAEAMSLVTAGRPFTTTMSAANTGATSSTSATESLSGTSAATTSTISPEMKAARKVITALLERSDRVYGIIYSALPDELRAQSSHIAQGWAYGLWHWLETKFQSTEEDSVGELLAQWTTLRQDDRETFDAYRARVNKLKELLKAAKEDPSARMYAYTLLDKLQPRYKQAVLALKAGGQLKDASIIAWDTVSAFINAHEREELRLGGEGGPNGQAMAASTPHRHRPASYSAASSGTSTTSASSSGTSSGSNGSGAKVGSSRGLDKVQCYNCKEYGHIRPNCDKPRRNAGGSDDSKSKPLGGVQQAKAAQVRDLDTSRVGSGLESPGGEGPWMIQGARGKTFAAVLVGGANSAAKSTSDSVAIAKSAAKSTVAATAYASTTAGKSLSTHSWGVDTMASLHISGNRDVFTQLSAAPPISIEVADGRFVTASMSGSVRLELAVEGDDRTIKIIVDNVYYNERFSANLLGWHMLKDKGWELHSKANDTHVVTPGGNKIQLSCLGRVSVLPCAPPDRVFGIGKIVSANVTELVRLHERLGHMSFDRMIRTIKGNSVLDVSKVNANTHEIADARTIIMECQACTQGKGHRTAFGHRGLDKGSKDGDVIHFDTFQVRLEDQGRSWLEYGLTATMGRMQWRWFAHASKKDEIPQLVIDIIKNAKTKLGCRIVRIYTDGGSEFINSVVKNFCREDGIDLHHSPAGTQQLNGVSENAVRSIKEMARTMVRHANTPMRFWRRAAVHAVYLWNRTHVSKLTGMTPYEVVHKKKPSVKHIGTFGCDAYYHIPKSQRPLAFGAKMEPCIYLGHDHVQNCACVWALASKKYVITRDVVYRPTSFKHGVALLTDEAAVDSILAADHTAVEEELAELQLSSSTVEATLPPPRSSERHARFEDVDSDSDSDTDRPRFVIDEIMAQRVRSGILELQVKWSGYDHPTWEPASDIEHDAPDIVHAFLHADGRGLDSDVESETDDSEEEPIVSNSLVSSGANLGANSVADSNSVANSSAKCDSDRPASASASQPRRSPRDHLSSVRLQVDDPDANSGSQVHMAMRAIRGTQSSAIWSQQTENEMACAVAAGTSILEASTPETYRQAMSGPDAAKWKAASDKEMKSCEDMGVWELVDRKDLPHGANVLPVKTVYKVKTDEHGDVLQHKARFTPKGFRQKEGRDCPFDLYARTGMYKTMRLGLSLAAKWDHELDQLDVPTAFLNADLEEEVYMELPEGYRDGKEHLVCRLKKSLYGLKQSPRNWYMLVSKFILDELGYKPTVSDPCLFHRRSKSGRLMMLFLFVDDFQSSYHHEDTAEWSEVKDRLVRRFNTKDLGPSKWILGMCITRNREALTITLDQELYVTKALERYGFAECKTAPTPEVVGAAHEEVSEGRNKPADRQRYMEITGTLMYAAISTRLDIAHAVHYLASHMLAPTQHHMSAAERVLRYLAGTREVGLVFGSRNKRVIGDSRGYSNVEIDVCAYADADWANGKADRRSILGWVSKLNGDPISWSSKKQRVVALSTCEAELYAEAAAIQEVFWLRGLAKELGLRTHTGSTVYGDNQGTIALSKNGVKGERTKHIDVKYHFVTESIEKGEIKLVWVPTNQQQADIFTKALPAPAFHLLRKQLMTE
jgi:hypothetical protein